MSEVSRFRHSCVLLLVVVLGLSAGICYGFGTFGFDTHHRFSDPVKDFLAADELPVKGSPDYYTAMVHRDRIIKGRHLAMENDQTPVTFLDGNETYRLNTLGFLHYANVSVGKPALSFLVALDTGSDLFCCHVMFWLCPRHWKTRWPVDRVQHLQPQYIIYKLKDDDESKPVEAKITFGCGKVQTGSFLMCSS
ncbi:Eukaryotic translation initiation factor 5 isoform 2 [Hibiscus syriacus]|uniref:Eukaryotic translation initiation factor 5 isoform 2 n=1 Tax=Hibiscus syriacus TaxID=106335 RepID=A0A6A3BI61_HIBSY|nr:Eukaryotic translation initiation factor 5 isoform 2 [Hibiscus syriacus]